MRTYTTYPHTAIGTTTYMSSYYYMYYHTCARIPLYLLYTLLYMCPHTSFPPTIYTTICVLIPPFHRPTPRSFRGSLYTSSLQPSALWKKKRLKASYTSTQIMQVECRLAYHPQLQLSVCLLSVQQQKKVPKWSSCLTSNEDALLVKKLLY